MTPDDHRSIDLDAEVAAALAQQRRLRGPPARANRLPPRAVTRAPGRPCHRVAILPLICAGAGVASFMLVLYADESTVAVITHGLAQVLALFSVQAVAVGMISGLGLYLYKLPGREAIAPRTAALRTLAGGVFGFLAYHGAAGAGLNQNLQIAAAGVGGGKGPDYLDKIADKLTDK